jgi:hypothetical protein
MNRARVQKAEGLLADQEKRWRAAERRGLIASYAFARAMERRAVPLRRLAILARAAQRAAAEVWSEATALAECRREARQQRAGRPS